MKHRTSGVTSNPEHRTSNLSSIVFRTAWGWMGIATSEKGVRAIVLPRSSRRASEADLQRLSRSFAVNSSRPRRISLTFPSLPGGERDGVRGRILRDAQAQVVGFLDGKRRELDFPVDLSRGSAFQRRVWRAILPIPYGRVRSYKWVALRVGGTRYARAVGHALGANPVPIVIPCHRVVAHDASLGGFTGGLKTKRRLLRLEGTLPLLKS